MQKDIIQKVLFVRQAIHSGWFTDDEITSITDMLGCFGDSAFRQQTQKRKLDDFLLDTNYWVRRIPVLYEMEQEEKKPKDDIDDSPTPQEKTNEIENTNKTNTGLKG